MKALKTCIECGEVWAEMRRLVCSNDSVQIKYQCPTCGRALSNGIPHGRVGSVEEIAEWDHKIADTRRVEKQRCDSEAYERERSERRAEYAAYLQSTVWRSRRNLVMQRAGGLCEGCRCEEASEVHHLTYAHIYAEFLFELVALCADCHGRWHGEGIETPWAQTTVRQ